MLQYVYSFLVRYLKNSISVKTSGPHQQCSEYSEGKNAEASDTVRESLSGGKTGR